MLTNSEVGHDMAAINDDSEFGNTDVSPEFDEEELFKLAYMAKEECPYSQAYHAEEDEDHSGHDLVVMLTNGSFHVCKGVKCPHVIVKEDCEKAWICQLSGMQVANHVEERTDNSTGRNVGSADPDMNSAAVKGWKFKRDAFGDSARAYEIARGMTEEEADENFSTKFTQNKPNQSQTAEKIKRGAPCVSEIDLEEVERSKRQKALNRANNSEDVKISTRLQKDASTVVMKIFGTQHIGKAAQSSEAKSSSITASDPRLQTFDFVFAIGLKKHIARCKVDGVTPTLDEIHDVAIAASNFSKEKRREAKKVRDGSKGRMLVSNTRLVTTLSNLIVSTWNAVVTTSHFLDHSSGDSFRPFAAGILYALKRGIRLNNNMVVIPSLPEISDQLPTLRSSTATPAARQLQASSHRGLCAVHKAIASIDQMPEEQREAVVEKLKITSGIAKSLEDYVKKFME